MKNKDQKPSDVKVIREGNVAFGFSPVGVYAFSVAGSQQFASPSVLPFYTHSRALLPTIIGDFRIVPMGMENNYPEEIRMIIDEDNFLPQGLKKDFGLIWGQGPELYKIRFQDGKRFKEFVTDSKIQAWLDSWDYKEYLLRATTDYTTINGHFTKFYRNRGVRVGAAPMIVNLEHVSNTFARLEWPDPNYVVHNIIVGDYRQPWKYGLRAYPVYDPSDPFAYPVAMSYSNLYNFSLDHEYSRAPFHGALNWIKLASSIPKLLSNFNANSAAIKYHIESPQEYWASEKLKLEQKCIEEGKPYTEKVFEDFKDKVFERITAGLSGIEKVGKIITTESFFSEISRNGDLTGWKITVLDQKVKDFIDAQIGIAREASFQVSAGIGLHPALSNLSKDGNLPSGSEQLYAFKLYLMTSIDIPELIIMKAINAAIRANFPGTDLYLGFYHNAVLTEEATNPNDRVKQADTGIPPKSVPVQ